MKKQRLLNVALCISLCVAVAAAGCKSGGGGDGDGEGGMGGDQTDSGDGDGDTQGSGGSEAPPDAVYPVYTGPGLQITIDEVKVSDKGVVTVDLSLADDAGRMLDREGILTAGSIAPGFVLSWLGEDEDGESTQFTAYTTREKVPAEGDPEIQSSTDAGGTYEKLALGKYRYTFGTKIDINEERSHLTHTLGVYGRRTFEGKDYIDNVLESWVPDGNEVETIYDVVTDEACNNCHTRLEFHGGQRRGVGMCNLCHTEANSINPESGNTVDFQVMIHKIHMGSSLPSVVAGEPYYFIGYMDAREDFSEVEYPWDMRDCSKCHTGTQGERWITRPAEKPCTSCHDRTYFGEGDAPEGWEKHTGGVHDDSECVVCHGEDSLEPISKSHYTSFNNPELPEVEAEIIEITSAGPGQNPNLEFEVRLNGAPHDLVAEPFSRMRMRIWGPGIDTSVGLMEEFTAAIECGDTLVRPCLEPAGDGFIYHSAITIPASAEGTFKVGLDGRYTLDGVNYPYQNPIADFVVSGELAPRREIVSTARCNTCHEHLGPHGGGYNQVAYCINCHIPSAYQSADEAVAPGSELLLGSINFKDMIHGIHSSVRYPAPLNDCAQCHEDGTTGLPLAAGLLPSTYAQVSCPDSQPDCAGIGGMPNFPETATVELPPESAACTSCHNETSDRAHADSNTSAFGEACATCHGSGKDGDVALVHELSP